MLEFFFVGEGIEATKLNNVRLNKDNLCQRQEGFLAEGVTFLFFGFFLMYQVMVKFGFGWSLKLGLWLRLGLKVKFRVTLWFRLRIENQG